MRHFKKGRKFGRERDQRRALLKSLASSFFMLGKIRITEAKAKELRPLVEKFITRAKNPTLHSQRLLHQHFSDKRIVKSILEKSKDFVERQGGYTRIIKLGERGRDGARMAILELIK